MDDPKRAADLFGQVLQKNAALAGPAVVRRAQDRPGRRRTATAATTTRPQAYEDARTRPGGPPGRRAVPQGRLRAARRGLHPHARLPSAEEYLQEWGEAFPSDDSRATGASCGRHSPTSAGQFAPAAREAGVLVKANPKSNYAAELLLLLAADAWEKLKDPAKAADAPPPDSSRTIPNPPSPPTRPRN